MKIRFSKVQLFASVALAVLPLYFLIAFSGVLCQFHHSEEASTHLHASSEHATHTHSSGEKVDFCKYFHDISQVALTDPILGINPLQDPVKFHIYSKVPLFTENSPTQYLRGPPFFS
jgi:hypothetical protein